ncbi:MAG: hypothetical protein RSB00_02800 [Bacilli bacterium]
MIVEVLYNELMLHGDDANAEYLKLNLPSATFIYTSIDDEPYFVNNKVNMIIMGSMTESNLSLVKNKLISYKERISYLINNNVYFFALGNSMEIFGKNIGNEEMLNIFDYYSIRNIDKRVHELFICKYHDYKVVGFISTFDKVYNISKVLFNSKDQSFNYNNFYGIKVLGPFLLLNPLFIKEILNKLDKNFNKLVYEEEIMNAYKVRKEEYEMLLERDAK